MDESIVHRPSIDGCPIHMPLQECRPRPVLAGCVSVRALVTCTGVCLTGVAAGTARPASAAGQFLSLQAAAGVRVGTAFGGSEGIAAPHVQGAVLVQGVGRPPAPSPPSPHAQQHTVGFFFESYERAKTVHGKGLK